MRRPYILEIDTADILNGYIFHTCSDGSVDYGQGGHSWLLTITAKGPPGVIEVVSGSGPVDLDPDQQKSYQSKLVGLVVTRISAKLLGRWTKGETQRLVHTLNNEQVGEDVAY